MRIINDKEIENKSVRRIQFILRELSRINPTLPNINVDGIYGEETTDSVITFQRQYGIPTTGIVDYTTWKKLHEIYNDQYYLLNRPHPIHVFFTPLENGRVSPGDEFDIVIIIQHMLHTISVHFDNYADVVITGIFDDATENAVRQFQKTNNLDVTGYVDLRTWNRLADLYNIYAAYGG